MKQFSTFVLACVVAAGGCSEPVGGISSDYSAVDSDPELTEIAQSLVPMIQALETQIEGSGVVPDSLEELNTSVALPDGVYFRPEKEYYRLGIKLGWDPALWFDSRVQTWTFGPGDGSSPKVIALKVKRGADGKD